ncbi:hypothetical protein KP509_03G075100 [Ceratopteris richardii]|uniref:Myb/SANT-like DNA-binding domain-containing protein n=1 Tax=Ceratopteris richardii TaxID=49495 RepID=A0A8T2V161_CERRI|nr:hypothetical protein KP509_03G075100 [Ceratopteris richardii]
MNDDRRGAKRSRVVWDDSHTFTLIKCFEDVYVHIKRGNLRLKDWEQVVNYLNKKCGLSFSCDQVRNRIDTLKKQHKRESMKQNSTRSTPSTWKLFDACESLWGSSPKCIEISGAFDSDGRQRSQGNAGNKDTSIEIDDTVREQASQRCSRKKIKQNKKSKSIVDGMSKMCDVMKEIESTRREFEESMFQKKIEDKERQRVWEEKIIMQWEAEATKRAEIQGKVYLELLKFMNNHHN